MFKISRREFQKIVAQAVSDLPADILSAIDNLEIVIDDEASEEELLENEVPDNEDLLGLFEGIPLTDRAFGDELTIPNLITIFQLPHEAACDTREDLTAQIIRTVRHEVAHHFGIDDGRLDAIGAY